MGFVTENLIKGQLLHGGDYNPDQWLDHPEVLKQDIAWMKEAHVNTATLGVFSWSKLEPEEDKYDLDWLEDIIDHLYENGIYTILATPTGALPHWMTYKYEETRQMCSNGLRRLPGDRHNMCPTAPVMREFTRKMNEELSQRFGKHKGVIAWHISNEYGGGGGDYGEGACYCPKCQAAFRKWLQNRYKTLDALNKAWWTGFWSNTYTDWEQIQSPSIIGETHLHGLKLDYKRFASDQMLDFAKAEMAAVRKYSDLPCVCNFMMNYKNYDYFKWAKELDFVSLDNYPCWHTEKDDVRVGMESAFHNTMVRSYKKQPFLLMESTPSIVNWQSSNHLKRPGVHALSSLQSIAYGSDSVQYFQWRKGRGSFEKYHGAVIDHKNGNNTRVFRDVKCVGERLSTLSDDILGTVNRPKAALVFDWENWWAVEDTTAVTVPFHYLDHFMNYFYAFWELGIDVDIVNMDDTLEAYQLVVAPVNYMYRGDYMENVKRFVKRGGIYVTTYWSGEVNESDLCFVDSHPLRDLLGIRTEEMDVGISHVHNYVHYKGKNYASEGLCALVHAETAEVLATYAKDFYAGYPALTVNAYGKGKAYYIAFENELEFLRKLYPRLLKEANVKCRFKAELPYGVTVSERMSDSRKKAKSVWFLQNFNAQETKVKLKKAYRNIETGRKEEAEIVLAAYEIQVLKEI